MDGRTLVLRLVLCPLRAPMDSVSPVSQLFVLLFSLKKKIFLFSKFLLFYYLKNCGDNDDAVDDNEYFIYIIGERNLAHHLSAFFIFYYWFV